MVICPPYHRPSLLSETRRMSCNSPLGCNSGFQMLDWAELVGGFERSYHLAPFQCPSCRVHKGLSMNTWHPGVSEESGSIKSATCAILLRRASLNGPVKGICFRCITSGQHTIMTLWQSQRKRSVTHGKRVPPTRKSAGSVDADSSNCTNA